MSSPLIRRGFGVTAIAALITLSAACGGSANTAICEDATKLFTDYSTQVTGAAGDIEGINQANADLASKFKDLAGKADGDLSTALTNLADTMGGVKIDASNPAASAAQLPELVKKIQDAGVQLNAACGS